MSHRGKTSWGAVEKLFLVPFFFRDRLFWSCGNLTRFDVLGNEIRISGRMLFFSFSFYILCFDLFSVSLLSCVSLLDAVCSLVSCRGRLSAEENIHGT